MLSFIRTHPLRAGSAAAVIVVGLAWLAIGYFGVHTLFVDDVVDESGPVFDAAPAALETASPSGTEPDDGQGDGTPEAVPTPADTDDDTDDDTVPDAAADTDDDTVPDTAVDTDDASSTGPDVPETSAPPAPPTPEIVTEYRGRFVGDAHPTAGDALVLGNGTGQRFLRLADFETDNGPDLNVYLVNSSTGDVSDYIDLGDLKGNIGDQNYEIPEGVDLDVYDEVVIWCVRFGVGFGDAVLTAA